MQKILVVVDMQNDFIDGALGTKEAQAITSKVISKIQNFDGQVIYTRDTHDDNYLNTQEGRKLPVKHCIKATNGWQLQPTINELATKSASMIFDKPSFGSPELAKHLAQLYAAGKLDEVEFVGVCTDICVISNCILLKAAAPELKVSVDGSCCAGVTPQSHDNALSAMTMCQIDVK